MKSKCKVNRKSFLTRTTALLVYRVFGASLLVAVLLPGGRSQSVSAGFEAFPQGMNPEQVANTIKANAQALKTFTYQERMQLTLKGETKKVTLSQISFDMYGNQQKTQLSEDPPADSSQQDSGGRRRGRIKEAVVAKKTGEFKQMMQEISALVKSYTELPPQQLQASLKQAAFSPGEGDMGGSVQILMRNVIHRETQ